MAAFPEHFPEVEDLDRYVRFLADQMNLRDWKVVLDKKAPDDDTDGQCRITYGRRILHIRLAEHETIEELRYTIVHELIHAHVEPISWGINNIEAVVGSPIFTVINGTFVDNVELAIDSMASAWAKTLPLPNPQSERGEVATDG